MTMTVGLPRAMLYHRYAALWERFFAELGVQTVVSGETTRELMERGAALSIDETCLSARIWFGHVESLLGKCDVIFVPRIASFGEYRTLCTRFEALPDLTRQVFRHSGQRFADCNVDVLNKQREEDAYITLGTSLGFTHKQAKAAFREAQRAYDKQWHDRVAANEQLYSAGGIRVMIAAHSYVYEDAFIGRPVLSFLRANGVTVIPADVCDRKAALRRAAELSPTNRWETSREIMGSVAMHSDKVHGVILMSAFPCGPDAMVNDMMQRKLPGVPMLNLTLDGQSGTAGQETRIESFVDIIRFKEGLL